MRVYLITAYSSPNLMAAVVTSAEARNRWIHANPRLSQLGVTKLPLLSRNIFAVCMLLHRDWDAWGWNYTERKWESDERLSIENQNRDTF